jgi:hypothetical protein
VSSEFAAAIVSTGRHPLSLSMLIAHFDTCFLSPMSTVNVFGFFALAGDKRVLLEQMTEYLVEIVQYSHGPQHEQ